MSLIAALTLSALLASQPPAETAPPPEQPPIPDGSVTRVEEIEVIGHDIRERVQDFIGEVAEPPRGRNLARWDRTICVGAVNMDNRYGQFMVDRVSQRALEAGLDVGEPGCTADVLIVATQDAKALATALVEDDPRGFRPSDGGTDMGSAALRRFQSSEAPVRWWYVSLPVSVDTGEVAVRLNDGEGARTVTVRDASRLRANVRDDLVRVIVLLDVSKIGQVSFGALSDYVAMVVLAQIDPAADASDYDSILNLFAAPGSPDALTDWDRDFIQALYEAPRDRATASQQARYIAEEMARSRAAEQAEEGLSEPEAEREP